MTRRDRVLQFPTQTAERLEVCCRAALAREERGEYEEACELLAGHWQGPGGRPEVHGLDDRAAGELLTRAGSLTAWLGSKKQIEGWQEKAKDLLSEAAARFESARDLTGWGWTQKGLALCYWREGSLSEARAIVAGAIERLGRHDDEIWIALQLCLAIVEVNEGRNLQALELFKTMWPVVERRASDLARGHYHNGLANARENLGDVDAAIIESTATAYHFEQANYQRGQILALNSLANLCRKAKDFSAAHVHLDRAERLTRELSDDLHLAHLKDSRALLYLAEGKAGEAEPAARRSVEIFERGDEHALLVRSLVTHARTLIALKDSGALGTYLRAYELAAEHIGSRRAGEIALETIGELAGQICLESHVTLDDARHIFEGSIIRRALDEAGGNITAAGLRLGESQQAMSFILRTRHQDLQPPSKRRPRHRSIVVERK